MPSRLWNRYLAGSATVLSGILWILFFTHEKDLYKLFALLGLTSGLAGVCILGARLPSEPAARRPVAIAFLLLAFFLHGFANFAPELFGQTEEAITSCAQCGELNQEDEDMEEAGPMYPDV